MSADKVAMCGCEWRYFPKVTQGWWWKCVKRCAEHGGMRFPPGHSETFGGRLSPSTEVATPVQARGSLPPNQEPA